MSGAYFVGLDVGTQNSKAVVLDETGREVAHGRAVTPWTVTATGAELDATALLDAAKAAVRDALGCCPPGSVAGLGVASLAESGILLDGSGRPVAPVIAWHDTRDHTELEHLRDTFGAAPFSAVTGLPLRQQWSLTKHRWLVDHVPATRTAVRRLNVAEWIVRGLGGEEATEASLASRTGWLRLQQRTWWTETLEWAGARESLMPPIVTAGDPLGRVPADAGLQRLTGAVLTVAGHDHQAAAIGVGADGPGDELDSCGTAEALVRSIIPGLEPSSIVALAEAGITTGWHAAADRWCLLGATQGGLALQRVLTLLGKTVADLPDLDAAALAVSDPGVRLNAPPFGSLDVLDIGDGIGPAHLWRAALDNVTDQLVTIHDAMNDLSGPHRTMIATGGWSRSRGVLTLRRNRFGEVVRSDVAEAGGRGAALLAARAAGVRLPAAAPVAVS